MTDFYSYTVGCGGLPKADPTNRGTMIFHARTDQYLVIQSICVLGQWPEFFTAINYVPVGKVILPKSLGGTGLGWDHHNYVGRQTYYLRRVPNYGHTNLLHHIGNIIIPKGGNHFLQWVYKPHGRGWDSGLKISGVFVK